MSDCPHGHTYRVMIKDVAGTVTPFVGDRLPWQQRLTAWLCRTLGHQLRPAPPGTTTSHTRDVGDLQGPHQQLLNGVTVWLQQVEWTTVDISGEVVCRRCGYLPAQRGEYR